MKVKHLLGILGIIVGVLVIGCGGGNSGLVNVNATQLYTTAGYTVDAKMAKAATAPPSNTR